MARQPKTMWRVTPWNLDLGKKNADYGKWNWLFLLILQFEVYNAERCQEAHWRDFFGDQRKWLLVSPENAWQLRSFYNWDGREAVSKLIVFFGVATKHALMKRMSTCLSTSNSTSENDTPQKKQQGNGKSPFSIGDTSWNGWFSIVMLVCWVVNIEKKKQNIWFAIRAQLLVTTAKQTWDVESLKSGQGLLYSKLERKSSKIWHFGCPVAFRKYLHIGCFGRNVESKINQANHLCFHCIHTATPSCKSYRQSRWRRQTLGWVSAFSCLNNSGGVLLEQVKTVHGLSRKEHKRY